jgi:hypothetical protein
MSGTNQRGWLRIVAFYFAVSWALVLAAIWASGCGNSNAATDSPSPPVTPDASMAAVSVPSSDDSGVGNAAFTAPSPDGGALEVHIQVNGGGNVCGQCAVVLAQVQGGTAPYTYTWSDPSWQGPGPFQLCPTTSTPVSLAVTDTSAGVGELPTADQTAQAATTVECVEADAASPPGELNGCTAGAVSGVPEAGTNDAGNFECTANEVEAGVAWADGGAVASEATPLPYTFRKGHTYSVSYDQLLPIELGGPVMVDIYGSTQPNVCRWTRSSSR